MHVLFVQSDDEIKALEKSVLEVNGFAEKLKWRCSFNSVSLMQSECLYVFP